jgi:hypothetical protein
MAHGLLSHAPFHVTARDPPEKVGIQIAKRLKEPNIPLIKHIVLTVGPDRAIQLLRDTEDCIAEGGIKTSDGRRRSVQCSDYCILFLQSIVLGGQQGAHS